MVLAEYPTHAEEQLISQAWIDRAVHNYKMRTKEMGMLWITGVRPVMGLDPAESSIGDKSVVTLRYNNFIAPQIEWQGKDPLATGRAAADIYLPSPVSYTH